MNTADKKIAEVLARFGEPMAGNVWRVQQNLVVYHKTLERIAAQAKITFDAPQVLLAERDAVAILVIGRIRPVDNDGVVHWERMEWSVGEACIGMNYRVSGKQAAYPFAMAEKRGKDRVILKLIELHGLVYSEEEADEFRASRPEQQTDKPTNEVTVIPPAEAAIVGVMKHDISTRKSINAVTDFMLDADTQAKLGGMTEESRNEIRDFAKARLVELGWPSKRAS